MHSQGSIIAHINYIQRETFPKITFNLKLSHKLHSMWNFHINYIQLETFTQITFNVKLSDKLHSMWNFHMNYIQCETFTNSKRFVEVDVCGKVWWKYFPRIVLCICFCPRMFSCSCPPLQAIWYQPNLPQNIWYHICTNLHQAAHKLIFLR